MGNLIESPVPSSGSNCDKVTIKRYILTKYWSIKNIFDRYRNIRKIIEID